LLKGTDKESLLISGCFQSKCRGCWADEQPRREQTQQRGCCELSIL
jgi:hypothetical protein